MDGDDRISCNDCRTPKCEIRNEKLKRCADFTPMRTADDCRVGRDRWPNIGGLYAGSMLDVPKRRKR